MSKPDTWTYDRQNFSGDRLPLDTPVPTAPVGSEGAITAPKIVTRVCGKRHVLAVGDVTKTHLCRCTEWLLVRYDIGRGRRGGARNSVRCCRRLCRRQVVTVPQAHVLRHQTLIYSHKEQIHSQAPKSRAEGRTFSRHDVKNVTSLVRRCGHSEPRRDPPTWFYTVLQNKKASQMLRYRDMRTVGSRRSAKLHTHFPNHTLVFLIAMWARAPHYSVDLRIYKRIRNRFHWNNGKLATRYPWIYGYFFAVYGVNVVESDIAHTSDLLFECSDEEDGLLEYAELCLRLVRLQPHRHHPSELFERLVYVANSHPVVQLQVQFSARDVIYTSRAYATMSVSVCLWRKCTGAL